MTIICLIVIAFIISSWFKKKIELLLPVVFTAAAIMTMALSFIHRVNLAPAMIYAVAILGAVAYAIIALGKRNTSDGSFIKETLTSKAFIFWIAATFILCIIYSIADKVGWDASAITSNPEYDKVSAVLDAARNSSILLGVDSPGLRLLNSWEFLSAKSLWLSNSWGIVLGKSIFLITMLLPLLSCACEVQYIDIRDAQKTAMTAEKKNTKGIKALLFKNAHILATIITIFLIFLAATDNELSSINPYFTNGLMFGCALVYLLRWFENHKFFYAICAGIMMIGAAIGNRIGIYSVVAFIMIAFIMTIIHLISSGIGRFSDHIGDKNYTMIGLFYGVVAIIVILAIYMYRIKVVGDDSFEKDVFNTFINASFTPYRYGLGIGSAKISIVYCIILLLGALVLASKYYKRYFDSITQNEATSFEINYILFIWSIVLLLILGGMYAQSWGRGNFNRDGEYLTNFEDYVQCPLVSMLYYYGVVTLRLLASKMAKR